MPVPFEALLPYGIMLGMFAITGVGLSSIRAYANEGKRHRRSIDQWDRVMMERDARLTGTLRGQSNQAVAPPGYELSSAWKVESRII
ncbi:hypothetical protein DFH27DRAFT_544324 [Peziza echinospora]|nr:hypothetical protein DFH27DRAFT_544324 [Peziza echinospora]